jgi:cell division protein FtsB
MPTPSARYTVPVILALLLGMLQYQIWTGRGSVQQVSNMRQALEKQQASNAQLEAEVARLQSEIHDLKDGFETVEEKARYELGMVKPNEIFVQIAH